MIIEIPPQQVVPETPQTMPPEENNVIDLRGEPLEIQPKEQEHKYCLSDHKNIFVDEQERSIECRECGKVIDSFDYLIGWCREGKVRMSRLKSLDDEIRMKHNELHEVKQALAREKAKCRRINPDAPEVITWQRQLANRKSEGHPQ